MATLPGLPDPTHPEDDPQALPVQPEMEPKLPGAPEDPEPTPTPHPHPPH